MYPTGDLNQDGIVDSIDLSILVSNWNTADPDSDINNDGIVDSIDLSILVGNWGETTPGPGTALLVTNESTLSTGHQNLSNILTTAGYSVITRLFSEPEDYTNIDVVIISIGNPSGDTGRYLNPPVGIVTVDSWRPLGMGTNLGFENNTNPVEVIAPSNPLAANVSGTFDAYLEPRYITWETDLSANPTVVVTRPSQPTQAVVFAHESGDTMTSRFATTRHVALGYHQDGLAVGLSTEATNQLLAAVNWAQATTYTAPPPPSAPTNVIASASNEQATISWDSVSSADSYTIKRSTTDGGPYTTIEANHTTTSYTDTNLTNGTTYYYVVSAVNSQGESSNSTQASATPVEGSGGPVTGQLALLVTSDELAMWQDRAVNGPFKSSGDFSTNSPGHWDEMVAAASLDFSSARWSGPASLDGDGSVTADSSNDPPGSTTRMACDMYAASINALVTENTTLANSIMTEMIWHAQQSRLNFANQTLWPRTGKYNDLHPLFHVAYWLAEFFMAYDICRSLLGTNSIVENWIREFGMLCATDLHGTLGGVFPNRLSGSWASRASWVNTDMRYPYINSSGNAMAQPRISQWYNNRRIDIAGAIGLSAAIVEDTTLTNHFEVFAKEWVMFGNRYTSTDGLSGDANRGDASFPQRGLTYEMQCLLGFLPAVEMLARQGNTNIYDFVSSDGASTPNGSSNHLKSFEDVIDAKIKWFAQTWPAAYSSDGNPPSSSIASNPYYRVIPRNTNTGNEIVSDGYLLFAANYFNRQDWYDVVLRVGTPTGFTPSVTPSGQISNWRVGGRNRFLRSLSANPHL